MPRTTSDAVIAILEVDEDIELDPFIETASALIEEICEPLGYNDTRLELIERWLSAHFYCIRDPRTTHERADVVEESFENKVDLGLNLTRYGQMAMRLDTKGGLANLEERIKNGQAAIPDIFWLGTSREDEE